MIKIDKEKLIALLSDFYNIFHIHMTIFDADFQKVFIYPDHDTDFCDKVLCSNTEICRRCIASDLNACIKCKQMDGRPYIYKCHAGIGGAVCAIKYNNLILGYIVFEQYIDEKEEGSSKEDLLKLCSEFNLDYDALYSLRSKLPVIEHEQLESINNILTACATYLWLEHVFFPYEDYYNELDKYIIKNIATPLSIKQITMALGISISALYKLSKHLYGMSIVRYIRKKRMEMAKNLLETTTLSIYQISNLVGIDDVNYFTKIFKSCYSVAPSKYRK